MDIDNLPMFKLLGLKNLNPEQEAFIFVNSDGSDERITLQDLYSNSNRLARILLSHGIGDGDSFSLIMRNHPEFIYAMLAAITIGATVIPIDPRSRGSKLSYQIINSNSKGILCTGEFLDSIKEISNEIDNVSFRGVIYKDHHKTPIASNFFNISQMLGNEDPELPAETVDFDPKRPGQIIYTSGTTGDPKGVVMRSDRYMFYGLLGNIFGYQKDDIPYTGLSLTHGNAQAVTAFTSLSQGIKAVISEKFTKSKIWDICRKYGCTTFSLLGGMMMGIYSEPRKEDDADNPVRLVVSAGTPKTIWKEFEERFNVKIFEWYGAVEGGLCYNPPGTGPIGSFGKPPEFIYEMKIAREDDTECEPGEVGELIFRPVQGDPEVEYYRNEKASKAKTRGGWQRSGDMCHRDADGWFYFDFRKGGGLRRHGDFIQPEFVEKIFSELAEISDVCVYGIPAETGAPGESDIIAAIVLVKDKEIDPTALFRSISKTLDNNSIPSYIQVVDEIPKTASEKNLDRVLRDEFSKNASNVYKYIDYR
ncbi:MAG: AMP-binding protein [Spirochaetota bacterium]|nr:AMP-binding protein [Spirochaetota bacterium]